MFADFVIFVWYISYFWLLVLLRDDNSESEVLLVGNNLLLFCKKRVNCGADDNEMPPTGESGSVNATNTTPTQGVRNGQRRTGNEEPAYPPDINRVAKTPASPRTSYKQPCPARTSHGSI